MRFHQIRKLYLPALLIVVVVFLLLVFITVSTYHNLNRDKMRALDFVFHKGMALIATLEASARAGIISSSADKDSFTRLVTETGKIEDIAYLYLLDSNGKPICHPGIKINKTFMLDGFPNMDKTGKNPAKGRIRVLADSSRIYEITTEFLPLSLLSIPYQSDVISEQNANFGSFIVIGLKMEDFEEARKADLHHAIIMVAIVVALGLGTIFFVFVIQKYYMVNQTLKQTQDYTRLVVDNMANGLLSIDTQGIVISFNRLALELLDLEESAISGMHLDNVIDFQETGIYETLTHCCVILDREIHHPHKSGETISLSLSVTPIPSGNGSCKGAVIVIRDLREIKRLEEKVRRTEKLATIGKLAAVVAHEIRNPLSSIKGFAQFLRHSLTQYPKEQEYAGIMVKEIDRINRVVTDLLMFARPFEAKLMETDVSALIEHTVMLVEADVSSSHVTIKQNLSADIGVILMDTGQMTQALLNLLLNALQVMPPEGGQIEVGAKLDSHESCLHLWVEDNGPGISLNQKERIFDPFYTTREMGTGLGLAIVNKIIENHSGEIRIESPVPGKEKGSLVVISIPTDTGDGAPEHPTTKELS